MSAQKWLFGLRAVAALGLGTSAMLWVDYVNFTPAFCAPDSGCAAVRASFGYVPIAGQYVPMPLFGLLGFAFLLALSLLPALSTLIRVVASFAGLVGVGLFLVQAFVVRKFCVFCVIADAAALLSALCAHFFAQEQRRAGVLSKDWFVVRFAWPLIGLLVVAAPLVWMKVRPKPAVPETVRALYQPGKINVVEFADFECPACRGFHPALSRVLDAYGFKVNFQRLNMPLVSHPHSRLAARAFVCGTEQGHSNAIADELFESADLEEPTLLQIAAKLGLDMPKFVACYNAPSTQQRIDRESQILRDAEFAGLPTTYIGETRLIGMQSEEILRDAFEREARGEKQTSISGAVYSLLLLLAFALIFAVFRLRSEVRVQPT